MAETTLHIAGRQYVVRCRDGEETHLAQLAELIEHKALNTQQSAPGMTEVRTLLFAALFLADEVSDLRRELAGKQEALALEADDAPSARAIEALASRIESLTQRLAPKGGDA